MQHERRRGQGQGLAHSPEINVAAEEPGIVRFLLIPPLILHRFGSRVKSDTQ